MPRKTLYIFSGLMVLVFALSLIFITETFWNMHGGQIGPLGIWVSRLMTAVMLANVYLFWVLRDEPASSKGAKAFSRGQVIAWGLTAVYAALMAFDVGLNWMIWPTVGLGVLFAILFSLDGFKN
jgi:hypothetical protein